MLCKGGGWHPLAVYSNSLLDNHDEESSSCGSYFSRERVISSTPHHLKRKSTYGEIQLIVYFLFPLHIKYQDILLHFYIYSIHLQ